jgi:hypothetical protein
MRHTEMSLYRRVQPSEIAQIGVCAAWSDAKPITMPIRAVVGCRRHVTDHTRCAQRPAFLFGSKS